MVTKREKSLRVGLLHRIEIQLKRALLQQLIILQHIGIIDELTSAICQSIWIITLEHHSSVWCVVAINFNWIQLLALDVRCDAEEKRLGIMWWALKIAEGHDMENIQSDTSKMCDKHENWKSQKSSTMRDRHRRLSALFWYCVQNINLSIKTLCSCSVSAF